MAVLPHAARKSAARSIVRSLLGSLAATWQHSRNALEGVSTGDPCVYGCRRHLNRGRQHIIRDFASIEMKARRARANSRPVKVKEPCLWLSALLPLFGVSPVRQSLK